MCKTFLNYQSNFFQYKNSTCICVQRIKRRREIVLGVLAKCKHIVCRYVIMQENPGVGNADNSTFTHQKENPERSASKAVSVSH